MTMGSLPRRQLLQATERVAGKTISVTWLGQYLADATFLVDHLAEANDPATFLVEQELNALEEIYAVALDRAWPEIPPEEAEMTRVAVAKIVQVIKGFRT